MQERRLRLVAVDGRCVEAERQTVGCVVYWEVEVKIEGCAQSDSFYTYSSSESEEERREGYGRRRRGR
eukprot:9491984-Pyramimonas_sp.AAC.1